MQASLHSGLRSSVRGPRSVPHFHGPLFLFLQFDHWAQVQLRRPHAKRKHRSVSHQNLIFVPQLKREPEDNCVLVTHQCTPGWQQAGFGDYKEHSASVCQP
jgi:hypothetical protein